MRYFRYFVFAITSAIADAAAADMLIKICPCFSPARCRAITMMLRRRYADAADDALPMMMRRHAPHDAADYLLLDADAPLMMPPYAERRDAMLMLRYIIYFRCCRDAAAPLRHFSLLFRCHYYCFRC